MMTRYASNATSERRTQTGINPAAFESEGRSRSHPATTCPLVVVVVVVVVIIVVVVVFPS